MRRYTQMAKPLTVTIPHQIGKAEARKRIETGFADLATKMGGSGVKFANVQQNWQNDRLHFAANVAGQKISGRLDVLEDSVKMEIDLPMILAAIGNAIRGKVQEQGRILLEDKTKKD
ncbi:MAG: polyhydroxyalkanoic acid system family protein [Caulobacterales bacterium]